MVVLLYVLQEVRILQLLFVDLLLLAQPQTVFNCDFSRVQVVHVELFTVLQDLHSSHKVDLVLVHS